MIKYILIDKTNLAYAVKIQQEIFPNYSAKSNYMDAINNDTSNLYWLLYVADDCVGISGFYHYDIDKKSAWLGWFGILNKHRNKGYGTMAFNAFIMQAKTKGYKYIRLYTDMLNNEATIKFYEKKGMIFEVYQNKEDETDSYLPILIFSKSLDDREVPRWNNKFIDLKTQIKRQTIKKS